MALLLALDESSSWLGSLLAGAEHDGTAEEQAYVAGLRAGGEWGDLDQVSSGTGLDLGLVAVELVGPATPLDLVALSEPPATGEDPARKVARLQHLDRVAALVASLRNAALVDLAGEESFGALLAEMHVEHEVAVARRTSRYSAGRGIENARALATVFPGFAAALRAGEVTEAHVAVLVERSRVVSDPEVLVEADRRALPKARRMTPGELGTELAAIIADVDPDAAARTRRARESRRVWTRPLDDGLSFLGLVHDRATIDAIEDAITTDADALRAQARERASSDGGADPERQEPSLDAVRADALAARVLGRVADDGTVTWDRSEAQVVVEVVMTLDQVRAEVDELEQEPGVALVDGAPVPATIAREVAGVRRLVAPARHRPGRRAPAGLRHGEVPAGPAAPLCARARPGVPRARPHRPAPLASRDGPRRRSPTVRRRRRTAERCRGGATGSRPRGWSTSSTVAPTARPRGSPSGGSASPSRRVP